MVLRVSVEKFDVSQFNQELGPLSVEERIRWVVEVFGDSAVLLSSMQKTSSVLMHVFYRLGLDNEILFCDTGFHFTETLRLRDEWMRRYRLNIITLYPTLTPEQQEAKYRRKLYQCEDGYQQCCQMRKEEPFLAHVRQHRRRLVMIGSRRSDGGRRAQLDAIAVDPRIGGYAFHPIYDWTTPQVDDYIRQHDVPVHPLHALGYPSIGCACCTTPVLPGEDERAGRWRHLRQVGRAGPTYCGLNFTDGSGI
jgi:phosphoadenosine phosphosulfate reductase